MLDSVHESWEGRSFGRLIQFAVDGYVHDVRGLWDIPEVASYFKRVHVKYPYLLYWMGKESIPLYCRILTGGSPTDLARLLTAAFGHGNLLCERIFRDLMPDDQQGARQLAERLCELATDRIETALRCPESGA